MRVWQKCGDMEHYLVLLMGCVHTLNPSHISSHVKTTCENNIVLDPLVGQWSVFTSEFGPVFQLNSVSEKQQELIKPFAS